MSKTFKIEIESCPVCKEGQMIFRFAQHKNGERVETYICNKCNHREEYSVSIYQLKPTL